MYIYYLKMYIFYSFCGVVGCSIVKFILNDNGDFLKCVVLLRVFL